MKIVAKKKLINPDIDEVSIVGKGANLKEFVFVKSADFTPESDEPAVDTVRLAKGPTSIQIESDGTAGGTKVIINGQEVDQLVDFNFSFYRSLVDVSPSPESAVPNDLNSHPVNCSYTQKSKGKVNGSFRANYTYILTKGLVDVPADTPIRDEHAKAIKEFLGTTDELNLTEEQGIRIAKSIESLAEYKDALPQAIKDAIGGMLVSVAKADTPKEKEIDVAKALTIEEIAEKAKAKFVQEMKEAGVEVKAPEPEKAPVPEPEKPVAETKPVEKPAEKPAEKPVETKPAEPKPAEKPVETKPAEPTPPATEDEIEVSPAQFVEAIAEAVQQGLSGTPSK